MGVYGNCSFLQPVPSGPCMNCSVWHFRIDFTAVPQNLPLGSEASFVIGDVTGPKRYKPQYKVHKKLRGLLEYAIRNITSTDCTAGEQLLERAVQSRAAERDVN